MLGRKVAVEVDDVLIEIGNHSDDVYHLLSGRLHVYLSTDDTSPVAQIAPGDFVGELAALAGSARTARVIATEASHLTKYSRSEFEQVMTSDPDFANRVNDQALRRLDSNAFRALVASLIGPLDQALEDSLEQCFRWRRLPAGTQLFDTTETADSAFLVLSGRVQSVSNTGSVVEYGPNDIIHAETLFQPASRPGTASASRDTTMLEITRQDFERLLVAHPQQVLALGRAVSATRLRRSSSATTLTVANAAGNNAALISGLVAEIGRHGRTTLLSAAKANRELDRDHIAQSAVGSTTEYRLTEYIHRAEHESDHVVLEADADPTEWTTRCFRQADRIVIVCSPEPDAAEHRRIMEYVAAASTVPIRNRWLAIVHPTDIDHPVGTNALMARYGFTNVAHVRKHYLPDIQRLARLATTRGTSIVLGGGGARGFAHLGVLRALAECGVPIDSVVGSSIGSVLGGFYALGTSHAERMELVKKYFSNVMDYTIPSVALIKGEKITHSLESIFGTCEIEDLWYPFACVSTNLTQSLVELHRTGPVAPAIRASLAIPGVIPPVPSGENLLVDGGVLNNLPIDVAQQEFSPGTLIAVDVAPRLGPHIDHDFGMSVSGWKAAASLVRHKNEYPGAASILLRSMLTASIRERDRLVDEKVADCYLLLPSHDIGMLDFHQAETVEHSGYESAMPMIERWLADGGWPTAEKPIED